MILEILETPVRIVDPSRGFLYGKVMLPESVKEIFGKIYSNHWTGVPFTVGIALGTVAGIAGGFWLTFQAVVLIGARL